MINHLEAYNLKDASHGMTHGLSTAGPIAGEAVALKSPAHFYTLIGELQEALNDDNVITLKRVIRAIIWDLEEDRLQLKSKLDAATAEQPYRNILDIKYQGLLSRKNNLLGILFNLENFHNFYKERTLGSRIGTSSAGRAELQHGMGLVVVDTLPARADCRMGRPPGSRQEKTLANTGEWASYPKLASSSGAKRRTACRRMVFADLAQMYPQRTSLERLEP